MGKLTTIGVYMTDLERMNKLSALTGKNQCDIIREILTNLEICANNVFARSISKGNEENPMLKLMVERTAFITTIAFLPKVTVVTETVSMENDA